MIAIDRERALNAVSLWGTSQQQEIHRIRTKTPGTFTEYLSNRILDAGTVR